MACEPTSLHRPRIELLAARVRWLDRYRRLVAVIGASVIAPFLIAQVSDVLGTDWPGFHTALMSLMLGVIIWWIVEVCLVYATAIWEAEHERLVRTRGLPRAILYKSR